MGILVLAIFTRVWKLATLPPSLYWEETALGYDAYSLLKTGKDYHGNSFPLVAFTSFGDYKPSLYFYALIPSIGLLGLNELAVRLPSAISGIAAVYFIYLIAQELKLGKRVALTAAFLLSVSPWAIHFSRVAFEVNLGSTLFLGGFYCLLRSRRKTMWLYLATVILSLSMYAHHGFRLLAPLFAIGLLPFLAINKKKTIHAIASSILALVLITPILLKVNAPEVKHRFQETNLLATSNAVIFTNRARERLGNTVLARLMYHRYWFWGGEVITNYFKHFNLNFLLLTGDTNPRHGTQEFGNLYHWEIISLTAAIYYLIKKKDKKLVPLLVFIFLSPLPSSVATGAPHALRSLPLAGGLALLSAYGLVKLIDSQTKTRQLTLTGILGSFIIIEFFVFSHFYFTHYSQLTAPHWQYGYKEVIAFTESVKDEYDHIYFTREYGRPSIYVLFYGKYNPKAIQLIEPHLKKDQQELLEFGKYQFTDTIPQTPHSLIVTTSTVSIPSIPLYTVHYPNGKPAFLIYEQ